MPRCARRPPHPLTLNHSQRDDPRTSRTCERLTCCPFAQIAALQHDSGTYLDEPEDSADFRSWSSTFR